MSVIFYWGTAVFLWGLSLSKKCLETSPPPVLSSLIDSLVPPRTLALSP